MSQDRESLGASANDGTAAREASHRIKNDLQLLASWIALASRDTADPRETLRTVGLKIGVIARLHERLSVRPDDGVDMDLELRALVRDLATLLQRRPGSVEIAVSATSERLAGDEARQVLVLAHELAVNALKHAFGARGGKVEISLKRLGGRWILTVVDDGDGIPDGGRTGTGSSITAAIVQSLGGTLVRRRREPVGTAIEVSWPSAHGLASLTELKARASEARHCCPAA